MLRGGGAPQRRHLPPDLQERLLEARQEWLDAEWLQTPRTMAKLSINDVLDELQDFVRLEQDYTQEAA